ncbi:MAG: hypothetical protein CFE23_04880 [Flavobacterium sp. BFFFF1]|uniref:hypothetical protein n=1 Tax=Flavobacterium sp. BFFFF1 TaxID=2015557 RepID=UPI000BCA1A76|nr:hypothetical protein [Flavobacterium sp. BFFFF1]OYU81423.1 MAG: hypothetical protein CFE23_04880 [Flavobacterium sp. BFFFF1]
MKKILFVLIAFAFMNTSQAQQIGLVRNAQFRITANLDPIKRQWEQMLLEQKIPAYLVNFEIQSGMDNISGGTYYMLLASNQDRSVKVARALQLKNGYLSFYKGQEEPFGIATCSGCNKACNPTVSAGKWICDGACAGDKPCEKTVTAEIKQ